MTWHCPICNEYKADWVDDDEHEKCCMEDRISALEQELAEAKAEVERCHAVMKVTCPSIEDLKAENARLKVEVERLEYFVSHTDWAGPIPEPEDDPCPEA